MSLDTSTDACSVAICVSNKVFSECIVEPQIHSKLIIDIIDKLCIEAGIVLDDINAFAFGRGPGSFTGVRIAASVIQGLAFGVSKPVIAISSLHALAQQAANKHNIEHIVPMLDARMHEVYWGNYALSEQGLVVAQIEDSIQKPEALLLPQGHTYLVVGTGAMAYQDVLLQRNPHLEFDHSIQYPLAQEVLQLALAELFAGNAVAATEAVPVYLRNEVAQKAKKNPDQGSREKN